MEIPTPLRLPFTDAHISETPKRMNILYVHPPLFGHHLCQLFTIFNQKMRTLLLTFLILLNSHAFSQPLTITKVSDSTYVFTTYQVYKGNLISSNGLIQQTGDGIVLIDTPWDTTQFQPLLDSIDFRFHAPVRLVIATHSHADRTAGLTYYRSKGIPTYSSFATWMICAEHHEPQAEHFFIHDTTFTIGNTSICTFYPGAGHTSDNIVIWLPQKKLLYGGCFIKSTEATDLGNLSDANLGMWPIAVKLVRKQFKHLNYVITGHQSWASKKSLQHTQVLLKRQRKGIPQKNPASDK